MKHARHDYNARVQDSANIIPEDEPVFLLRGKDEFAVACVRAWADLALKHGLGTEAGLAQAHADEMEKYRFRLPPTTSAGQETGKRLQNPLPIVEAIVWYDRAYTEVPKDEDILVILEGADPNGKRPDFRKARRIGHYPDRSCVQVQSFGNAQLINEQPLHSVLRWARVSYATIEAPQHGYGNNKVGSWSSETQKEA